MKNSSDSARDVFLECNWIYDASPDEHFGYSSVSGSLRKISKEMSDQGRTRHSEVIDLLSKATSMRLVPNSKNEPFEAYYRNFEAGRRTYIPDDFTADQLEFFAKIVVDIDEPWLKARIADLLWLIKTPRNPEHARLAIDSYISHSITEKGWHRDVGVCWERAARLCKQIRDSDRLDIITTGLYSAFCYENYSNKNMGLFLANLLDSLKIDGKYVKEIATSLFNRANDFKTNGDYNSARSYYELASKKHRQSSDDNAWVMSLLAIAECFEIEADMLAAENNMVANTFYENAMQAYRKIPTKYRDEYAVNTKLPSISKKISSSGKATLDEMGEFCLPGIDISDIAKQSIEHVSGKRSFDVALLFFTGIYAGPKYDELKNSAKALMQETIFSSLAGIHHMSADGRVIAKTPAMNMGGGDKHPDNIAALHCKVQQGLVIELRLVVEGRILPALGRILKEHRITSADMIAMCHQSPLVPEDREKLLGFALWLGFENEFGSAIHLLTPQVEHMVRIKLKATGASTTNIDKDGIEKENGLSSLMELPEALELFGEDLVYEIKSVFTDPLGFNLRNEVAHGLLDDNTSASVHSIYAWWMVIKLIIHSLVSGHRLNNSSDT